MRALGPVAQWSVALAWAALLVLVSLWAAPRLALSGDLRLFMPEARTAEQRLLLDELGEGPGSRLLLVALSGADPGTLAAQSRALRDALSAHPAFASVGNGDADLGAIPARLHPYRYLLTEPPRLDAVALRAALDERLADLGSPMAARVEALLPSDPTLQALAVAQAWMPRDAPQLVEGVWFDRAGRRALLALQTRAAGFDPTGQAVAVAAVQAAFEDASRGTPTRLAMSGPGAFSVEIGERTRREATRIGTIDGIAFALLLLLAYRSMRAPLLGALPLATGGVAGLAAVALAFDGVHGITVAFGFTLVGVAQDYPIHLFSHHRAGLSPWANARALWPTLGTGVASTCIAYLTFLLSGVEGLQQLAVFTVVGLGTAALATRFVLPALVDPGARDVAATPWVRRLGAALARMPRMPAAAGLALGAAALAVALLAPGAFWQNDLARLTPVPPEAMARDADLRGELGAPDVRYLVAVDARDVDGALLAVERMQPALERLRARGVVDGWRHAAQLVPSSTTQATRAARLPEPAILRAALADATAGSAFDPAAFEPFLRDVETARTAAPLRPSSLAGTPLGDAVNAQLVDRGHSATALVAVSGLTDAAALDRMARANGARLLDLKAASESLVAGYRQRVLQALALAAVLLAATVWIALRAPGRVARVLAPMALTTLLLLAVLRAAGVELNLFHLVALILAAGLGLDYALFFDHAGDAPDAQARALHAIVVCAAITLLVFALLATSSIPVLRAIGTTVALGVAFNFLLATWIVRRPARSEAA
mgnify:CR=1 FL=1